MSAAGALPTVLDMTTTELAGLAELKQFTRATWAAGNFPEIARRGLWEVGERIVQRVGSGRASGGGRAGRLKDGSFTPAAIFTQASSAPPMSSCSAAPARSSF